MAGDATHAIPVFGGARLLTGARPVRYVALLHSIVLGQGRRVGMADLRAMAADLGLVDARTLVATGNLVFACERTEPARLETLLEGAFARRFGKHVDIILRDAPSWRRLLAGNPFPEAAAAAPARVAVRVMRAPIAPELARTLDPYRAADERMTLVDGDLWLHCPRGFGGSKLAALMTPRRAGGVGTVRNWNTARRLGAMLDG